MKRFAETDIVNSATRLEQSLEGVHPRLFLDEAGIAALRAKCGREPWAGMLKRVVAVGRECLGWDGQGVGGDLRGIGSSLANLAVAYRLTGDPALLAAARRQMKLMLAIEDWTYSLNYAHWAAGMGLAYDWLYHELEASERQAIRETLLARTQLVRRHWESFKDAYPTGYAWNHMGVVHGGMLTAGCALWGDLPGVAPILRLMLEKLRLMVGALGSDGASAEGLPYGQYHLAFLLKSLLLARDLLNEDHFDCPFLRAYPKFVTYSALPRSVWRGDRTFLQIGDCEGAHWYGPDAQLRVLARVFRDPRAQWLADATCAANVNADSDAFVGLLQYDETVPTRAPDDLPTWHHLADKDIVIQRADWQPTGAVAAFKCGPNSGHHAKGYRHNIGGGHMHPDAGHLILHAEGDWLLTDGGYTKKFTQYRNTVLVNGIGQTGEGGVWFEDLEMRRGKPEGCIRFAGPHGGADYAIGEAGPAYEYAAGLQRFLRHLIFIKPRLWIVVDELQTAADAAFEWRWHGPRAFTQVADGAWAQRGDQGALRLLPLGPTPVLGDALAELAFGAHAGHHPDRTQHALVLRNATPTRQALLVTVLYAHPASQEPELAATLSGDPRRPILELAVAGRHHTLTLHPWQAHLATPIYTKV